MTNPRIGLLPLYLELYDKAMPEVRSRIDDFHKMIARELAARGLEVTTCPVCCIGPEFAAAIRSFETANADAIVTLHLAYSPSLESAPTLAATALPIIVLDTTPGYAFGPRNDPGELMYNHGIHGVQDLCNVLRRHRKPFQIEAGHWQRSDVLDRVAAWAHAAALATRMRNARVGRIGEAFPGMGDFTVPQEVLKATIGVETVACDLAMLRNLLPAENDAEVASEMASDLTSFATADLDSEAHLQTTRACLAVRKWIERERLTAFTFNFLTFDRASGIPTPPFLEASKALARGIGYAGEGDVLTAALVGVLASAFPDTSFTEIFCPDWADNRIFLSHMGEMNVGLAADTPRLKQMHFPWTDAQNPVLAVGRFRAGPAALVNLAPGPDDTYALIVAPVMMLDVTGPDQMSEMVHGWFRPEMPIADFIAEYSRAAGTHHSALVYGDAADRILRFGQIMDWNVIRLPGG